MQLDSSEWYPLKGQEATHTILDTEVPFKHKNSFYCESAQSAVQAAESSCAVSVPGAAQDPSGHGPKHRAPADPALSRGLGTGWSPEVLANLSSFVILHVFNSVTVIKNLSSVIHC